MRWSTYAFIVLFCSILAYGAWLYIAKPADNYHFSTPEYYPAEMTTAYEAALTKSLTQQKHPLLTTLAFAKWNYLNAPLTHKIEKGKNGWIFLREEIKGRNSIHQSMGVQHLTPMQLKLWRLLFQQRHEWTTDQGISYVLVAAPNKETIYPEYLPDRYVYQGPGILDQLKAALPDIYWIDLRDCLRNSKSKGILYFPDDTHWNELGGFTGYQCVMNNLPAPFRQRPLSLSDCKINPVRKPSGDLARLALMDADSGKIVNQLLPINSSAQVLDSLMPEPGSYLRANPKAAKQRVYFEHDSFLKDLIPLFAEHYNETAFWWKWQGFHSYFIASWKPQLVVNELVERAFFGDKPRNDSQVIQHYWKKHIGQLQQIDRIPGVPLHQLAGFIEKQYLPENIYPILQLDINVSTPDQLIVTYGDEDVTYDLQPPTTIIYLEYETKKLKWLTLKSGADLKATVAISAY